jgi:hypothetical protein
MDFIGEQDVTFPVNGRNYRYKFRIRYLSIKADGNLGLDFFVATGAIVDFGRREMKLYKCPALGSDNMDRRGWVFKPEVNHITRQRTPLKCTCTTRDPRRVRIGEQGQGD